MTCDIESDWNCLFEEDWGWYDVKLSENRYECWYEQIKVNIGCLPREINRGRVKQTHHLRPKKFSQIQMWQRFHFENSDIEMSQTFLIFPLPPECLKCRVRITKSCETTSKYQTKLSQISIHSICTALFL